MVLSEILTRLTATVTISANTSFGSGATGVPYIGPRGGHGKNAREELGGSYVMVATEISGNEVHLIITSL